MSVKLDLRNKLINGSLDYWQRNTSFAAVANSTYTADRWTYLKSGTMVHTVSRSSDVPSSAFGQYSLLADCTTAQASIGAGNYVTIEQRIEGNVLRSFKGKKLVLVFWVKSTKTGIFCMSFRNSATNRSLIKEYTVSASNTWEKKTIRFEHDPTGAWLYDTGVGMRVDFVIAAGSTFQTTPNAWVAGDFLASANQVNGVDNVANDFYLSDICMVEDNEGQTREPDFQLAGRDLAEELQLCQRYFAKSAPLDTPATTGTSAGAIFSLAVSGNIVANISLPSVMRIIPIVTTYATDGGTINAWSLNGTRPAANVNTTTQRSITFYGSSGVTTGNGYSTTWVADAEL